MVQKARQPASRGPLCSQCIISSSEQILNSAPFTALSPNEAIKSMLIPHQHVGEGQPSHTDTERAQTRYLVAKFGPGGDEMEHNHCKPTEIGRAWSTRPSDFDLVMTHDVGQHVRERIHDFLTCNGTIHVPTTDAVRPSFLFSPYNWFPQL